MTNDDGFASASPMLNLGSNNTSNTNIKQKETTESVISMLQKFNIVESDIDDKNAVPSHYITLEDRVYFIRVGLKTVFKGSLFYLFFILLLASLNTSFYSISPSFYNNYYYNLIYFCLFFPVLKILIITFYFIKYTKGNLTKTITQFYYLGRLSASVFAFCFFLWFFESLPLLIPYLTTLEQQLNSLTYNYCPNIFANFTFFLSNAFSFCSYISYLIPYVFILVICCPIVLLTALFSIKKIKEIKYKRFWQGYAGK